MKSSFQLI